MHAYAEFWRANKEYYGIFELEWIVQNKVRHFVAHTLSCMQV